MWFDSGQDVINYLNSGKNRRRTKLTGFEYFGHSNRHCFMFDYSCDILGASSAFLHENDLKKINAASSLPELKSRATDATPLKPCPKSGKPPPARR